MKILITNYTFDASAKTITFNDYGSIVLDGVLLVANVTDNIIIYNFASSAKGGSVATNVLTLDYDTTSMDDTDDLLIYYDDPSATQTVTGSVTANAGTNLNTSALALEATLQSIKTAVETLDNIVSGSEAQVDVLTLPLTKEDGLILGTVDDTTVDSTEDLIFDASVDEDVVKLRITNCATTILYYGKTGVTTTDFMGYVPPKQSEVIEHAGASGTGQDLYGIRDSGNSGLCKVFPYKYK